jgi:hypothetical protein
MIEFYQKNPSAQHLLKHCEFKHLVEKERWTSKYFPFYIPPYEFYSEYSWNYWKYFLAIVIGIMFFKIGFHYGLRDSIL